jgi:hypothetical protein
VGIFGSFKQAGKVINDAKRDVEKGRKQRPRDEVADRRQQRNGGKK